MQLNININNPLHPNVYIFDGSPLVLNLTLSLNWDIRLQIRAGCDGEAIKSFGQLHCIVWNYGLLVWNPILHQQL